MPTPSIPALVAEGSTLKETIKTSTSRLKEIEALLIEKGVGDYQDSNGHTAKVIQPANTVVVPADLENAQQVAGDNFGKLFEKVITYKPVKAFKEVAAALLSKRTAAKLTALCEQEKSAYVKWS